MCEFCGTNQMFYKVDISLMYYGIESRQTLVENDILNYRLRKSFKGNNLQFKKAIKNHNMVISKNNNIIKKLMRQKKKFFVCTSSFLNNPSKKEINDLAKYLGEFLNQENFIPDQCNKKRQSQIIKRIYKFIS